MDRAKNKEVEERRKWRKGKEGGGSELVEGGREREEDADLDEFMMVASRTRHQHPHLGGGGGSSGREEGEEWGEEEWGWRQSPTLWGPLGRAAWGNFSSSFCSGSGAPLEVRLGGVEEEMCRGGGGEVVEEEWRRRRGE